MSPCLRPNLANWSFVVGRRASSSSSFVSGSVIPPSLSQPPIASRFPVPLHRLLRSSTNNHAPRRHYHRSSPSPPPRSAMATPPEAPQAANKAISKLDLDGHNLPPSPAPSSPQ